MQWASLRTWTKLACPREEAWQDGFISWYACNSKSQLLAHLKWMNGLRCCSIQATACQPGEERLFGVFLLWQDFGSFNFVISREWHVWVYFEYTVYFSFTWVVLIEVLLSYPWRSQIRVLWLCSVFGFGIVSDYIGLASLFWHGILWSVNEFLGSKDSGGMATPLLAMVQHNKVRDRQYWRKMADGVVTQP